MDDVKVLLGERLKELYEKLAEQEPGSKEYNYILEQITELHKLMIEEEKVDAQYYSEQCKYELEKESQEKDLTIKREQMESDRIRSKMDLCKTGLILGGYGLLLRTILKFEETGSIRTKAFNTFMKFKSLL